MGYDIHITRAAEYYDSGETPITLSEWLAYVEAAPDLLRGQEAYEDGFAFWTGHPDWTGNAEDGGAWLRWFEGAIESKYPDDYLRRRMYEIAQHFNARVQGDEGELYDADGRVIPDEDWDEEGRPRHPQKPKSGVLSRLFGRR